MERVNPDTMSALRIVWMALTLAILALLVSPFLLGRERVSELVPMCERQARYGLACPFCGMTSSFLDISEGRFSAAGHANRAGIPLYLSFVSNEFCALAFLRRKRGTTCKH